MFSFLFPCSFFLIPFLNWGDQCLSLDVEFDTIVLLITTIIQSDRMHILEKINYNVYNQISQFTNIE